MASERETERLAMPALLRHARDAYAKSVRASLAQGGFEDMPRNGPYVVGGMGNRGGSAAMLIRELGVSKQAASQLIDTLVIRGYLSRSVDPDDRRRMTLELTARGRAAADTVFAGVQSVDEALASRVPSAEIATLRVGLEALGDISEALDVPPS